MSGGFSKVVSAFALALALPGAQAAVAAQSQEVKWDTHSDTWAATDALGRTLPDADAVGGPRTGKTVGIFYFLWLGQHGQQGPFDITKILARDPGALTNPVSPSWGPMYAPHHWGESIFGYYVFDDEAVLRKHAQMLSDAGVDVVIFDVTNQPTYPGSWQALCRVWQQVRREGNRTPQVAFLCPFWDPRKNAAELWEQLYSRNLYPELWFRWAGKPLLLADPARLRDDWTYSPHETPAGLERGHTLGQSIAVARPIQAIGGSFPTWTKRDSAVALSLFRGGPDGERLAVRRFEALEDNGWCELATAQPWPPGTYYLEISQPKGPVGWWSASRTLTNGQAFADGLPVPGARSLRVLWADQPHPRLLDFFTFRKPQPDYFVGPTGPNQWAWLEVFPQHVFTNAAGDPEQMSVGVAQNAVEGRLGVLSDPRAHGRSYHNGGQPAPPHRDFSGRNFAEQWERALAADPAFIFVTGWNEWIAGRMDSKAPFHGAGPVSFVDQFNQEFSRDIEPMQGGHGDNYYYQLAAWIRRFKGVRPLQPVVPAPIALDGKFKDWAAVQPEFRDTLGDPVRREHRDWSGSRKHVNRTGRNDIIAAKVSFDARALYFHVRTRDPLRGANEGNWMLLFLDVDGNGTNGWLGYDFVLNRSPSGGGKATLEKNLGGYRWGHRQTVTLWSGEAGIELAVPLAALGLSELPAHLDFKWADNIQQTGEWSDFTLNGDAAPNDRFNYRARFKR